MSCGWWILHHARVSNCLHLGQRQLNKLNKGSSVSGICERAVMKTIHLKASIRTVWTSYICVPEVSAIDPNMLEWRNRRLPITGVIFRASLPCNALHGFHRLSREFTGSSKLALEKQISQSSLVVTLCMSSV